jgi:hypothetical protein
VGWKFASSAAVAIFFVGGRLLPVCQSTGSNRDHFPQADFSGLIRSVEAGYLPVCRQSESWRFGIVLVEPQRPSPLSSAVAFVDSWAEPQRQRDRFTLADRPVEEQVFHFAREPTWPFIKNTVHDIPGIPGSLS